MTEAIEAAFSSWWKRWKRMENIRELSKTAFQAGYEAAMRELENK